MLHTYVTLRRELRDVIQLSVDAICEAYRSKHGGLPEDKHGDIILSALNKARKAVEYHTFGEIHYRGNTIINDFIAETVFCCLEDKWEIPCGEKPGTYRERED